MVVIPGLGLDYTPGVAAVVLLAESLAAKMFMSFGVRVSGKTGDWVDNASKAQLNVAEYEALFIGLFLFFNTSAAHIDKDSVLLLIVTIVVPIAQAVYFWGRVSTGNIVPWAPMGALPRYFCQGSCIYLLYTAVGGADNGYGPGLAAVAVLTLSLAAKMTMSFAFRVKPDLGAGQPGYENVSKAQNNVKEYEAMFIVFFLFFVHQPDHQDGFPPILLTIVSYGAPIAQAVYFWGRVITGTMLPITPMAALPRYAFFGMSVYILWEGVGGMEDCYGPGMAAVVTMFLSLVAKLFMSFGVRVTGPKDQQGYDLLDQKEKERIENASKAQLNVAEYEDLFVALFLYLFMHNASGLLVTIVLYTFPTAQFIYFWGRVCSGKMLPWAPLGALPRYLCQLLMVVILFQVVTAGNGSAHPHAAGAGHAA